VTHSITESEITKLARELGTEPSEFAFLAGSTPEALRNLRYCIAARLDEPHRPMFRRLARASSLVPVALGASIATRFFGPMLCGAVASELAADRAASFIGHLPMKFVADVTPYVNPRTSEAMIKGIELSILVPVMKELLRRRDLVTVSRLVEAATQEQVQASADLIEDPADLLAVYLFAESNQALDAMIAAIDNDRLASVVVAAREADLDDVLAEVFSGLSEPGRRRVEATDLT
jgi:hypothetical protein